MTATASQPHEARAAKSTHQHARPQLEPGTSTSTITESSSGGSSSSLADPTQAKRGSNFVTRLVKIDDTELCQMAHGAEAEMDWDAVMLSPRVGPGRWRRVDAPAGDFAVYTRQECQRFAVLTVGLVPACVAEIVNVLQCPNSAQYEQQMQAIYQNQYREGMLVHRVNLKTPSPSNEPAQCVQLQELTVKTVTFAKANWFADHEEWCYVDAVFRDPTTGVVQKIMKTIPPSDVLAGLSKTNSKFFHNVTCSYLLRPGASDWQHTDDPVETARRGAVTRVTMYAEFNVSKRIGVPLLSKVSNLHASEKTIKQRLLKLAENSVRFTELVRRQRLGLQAIVDSVKFLPPTNTPCTVCSHFLTIATLCRVCGYGVCRTCSAKHERATHAKPTGQLQVSRIRVCANCMNRVDQALYTNVSTTSLLGPHVVADPVEAPPPSSVLQQLLVEALETAPSPSRKACVMSVIQNLQDQDAVASKALQQTLQSEDDIHQSIEGIQVDLDFALDLEIRKNDQRSYRVNTSGNPTVNSIPTPLPENEEQRIQAVSRVSIAELRDVIELKIICDVAAQEMGCNLSTIAIINQDTFQVVASNNNDALGTLVVPRNESMCSHTIMERTANIVPHPEADIRFNKFDSVDQFNVRYYCGFPIVDAQDQVIGAMCCVNSESVQITQTQFAVFKKLAETASKIVRVETGKSQQVKALSKK